MLCVFVWGTMAPLHIRVSFSPLPLIDQESQDPLQWGSSWGLAITWIAWAELAPGHTAGICSLCKGGRAVPLVAFSFVFWNTWCQGLHNRPWLTWLRYKGVCYTLQCEKPSGHSHIVFQNSVRSCMVWCFSWFIPTLLCSRSGCKLVPCMVVLPHRYCGAIGGVQAQQEGCLLFKCGQERTNTTKFYTHRSFIQTGGFVASLGEQCYSQQEGSKPPSFLHWQAVASLNSSRLIDLLH